MAKRLYPTIPSWMLSIKFDSISKINHIKTPKLILHSHEDNVVPFSMGQKLYQNAVEPKEFLEIHGGHNEADLISNPNLRNDFKNLLKKYSLL